MLKTFSYWNYFLHCRTVGRARAENADFILVTERGSGTVEKEDFNKIRETMMQKAIDIIQHRMTLIEIQTKISAFQKVSVVERQMACGGKAQAKKARHDTGYSLRCLKCDSFAVHSSDMRTIENIHHVIIDSDYKSRVNIQTHPNPKKFSNMEYTDKLYCKKCGSDWGVTAVYKSNMFPIIKISSFVITDELERRTRVKQWKDSPFAVNPMTPEDLVRMIGGDAENTDSSDSDNDDDDDNELVQ